MGERWCSLPVCHGLRSAGWLVSFPQYLLLLEGLGGRGVHLYERKSTYFVVAPTKYFGRKPKRHFLYHCSPNVCFSKQCLFSKTMPY